MDNNSIFIEKLRSSGLRLTKQRLEICKLLFDRKKTFHFTINDLCQMLKKETNKKISLATLYNTVHSFKKKGCYLSQVKVAYFYFFLICSENSIILSIKFFCIIQNLNFTNVLM